MANIEAGPIAATVQAAVLLAPLIKEAHFSRVMVMGRCDAAAFCESYGAGQETKKSV